MSIAVARADEPTPAALSAADQILVDIGMKPSIDLVVPEMLGSLNAASTATRPEIEGRACTRPCWRSSRSSSRANRAFSTETAKFLASKYERAGAQGRLWPSTKARSARNSSATQPALVKEVVELRARLASATVDGHTGPRPRGNEEEGLRFVDNGRTGRRVCADAREIRGKVCAMSVRRRPLRHRRRIGRRSRGADRGRARRAKSSSPRNSASAAPASSAVACRRSCWSTRAASPTNSPTPQGSVGASATRFDWPTLVAAKEARDRAPFRRLSRQSRQGRRRRSSKSGPTIVGPHAVRLGRRARASRARHILVATGARPSCRRRRGPRARDHLERGLRSRRNSRAGCSSSAAATSRSNSPALFARARRRGDEVYARRQHFARLRRRHARRGCATRWGAPASRCGFGRSADARSRRPATALRSTLSDGDARSKPTRFSSRPAASRNTARAGARSGRRRRSTPKGAIVVDDDSRTSVPIDPCGRRRHQPHQPDAGGDPRGPCARRPAVRRQAGARRSRQRRRPRCSPRRKSARSA